MNGPSNLGSILEHNSPDDIVPKKNPTGVAVSSVAGFIQLRLNVNYLKRCQETKTRGRYGPYTKSRIEQILQKK